MSNMMSAHIYSIHIFALIPRRIQKRSEMKIETWIRSITNFIFCVLLAAVAIRMRWSIFKKATLKLIPLALRIYIYLFFAIVSNIIMSQTHRRRIYYVCSSPGHSNCPCIYKLYIRRVDGEQSLEASEAEKRKKISSHPYKRERKSTTRRSVVRMYHLFLRLPFFS